MLQNWLGAPADAPSTIVVGETALAGRKVFVYAGNMGVAQGMGRSMAIGFAEQDVSETAARKLFARVRNLREVQQSRQDVAILHQCVGSLSAGNSAGPASNECRMQASVPVGPLAAGELRSLFRREQHQSVVRLTDCVEYLQQFTHLAVHVGDFRQVAAEVLSSSIGIGDIRRQANVRRRIL